MEPTPTSTLARRLWQATEPLHAVAYFHPEATDVLKRLGTRGWWMSYFAGRFAPLGAVGPAPVAAMAFGFSPAFVARSIPDAWDLVSPAEVVRARVETCAAVLREALPGSENTVDELARLLGPAAAACRYEGRPLAAGWMAVDPGDDPYARLWAATSVLREHRGDGHVIAAVSLGLRGLDTALTHVAAGGVTRELIQRNRGWTDEEWDEGERRLQAHGWVDGEGRITEAGVALRHGLEETTDRLAGDPIEHLGAEAAARAVELAAPLSRALIDAGVIPVPNPIGVPRP